MRQFRPILAATLLLFASIPAFAGGSTAPVTRLSSVPGLLTVSRALSSAVTGMNNGLGVRVPPADGPAFALPTIGAVTATNPITGGTNYLSVVNSANGLNPIYRYDNSIPVVWRGTRVRNLGDEADVGQPGGVTVEFTTDSQYMCVQFFDLGGSMRVWVDGNLIGKQASGSSTAADAYQEYTFATRAIRNIRIEFFANFFEGIVTYPGDTVFYPVNPIGLKCIWKGASFTEGIVGDTGEKSQYYAMPLWVGEIEGWNVIPLGSGGTGFVNQSYKLNYVQAIDPANSWHVNLAAPIGNTCAISYNGQSTSTLAISTSGSVLQGDMNTLYGVFVNEQGATGGTYTLTVTAGAHTTAAIPFGDTAAQVATALTAASITGTTVTGSAAAGYVITGYSDNFTIVSSLTGGTANISATVTPNLVVTGYDIQDFVLTPQNTLLGTTVAPTITSNTLTYSSHYNVGTATVVPWLGDIVPFNPDVVVIASETNDTFQASSATQAAATTTLAYIRQNLPNALIIVIGPWSPWGTPSTGEPSVTNTQAAIVAAIAASGCGALYISTFPATAQTSQAGSWVTGGTISNGVQTGYFYVQVPAATTAFTLTVGANVATVTQGSAATTAQIDSALAGAVAGAITHGATIGQTTGPFLLNGITGGTPTAAVTGGSGTIVITPLSSGNSAYVTGTTNFPHPLNPGVAQNGSEGGHQYYAYQIAAAIAYQLNNFAGIGGQ